MSEAAGWYADPYFGGRERYWDGDEWTEQCRATDTKEHQASAKPRAPLNPERATPSAVAAKFERRAGGNGLATMVRPAARETASASPTMTPPTSPPSPPPTTAAADDSTPVTPAWPTDTGWTMGAAATTAAGAADASPASPPPFEPPAPPTDAVPAFEEPTDHTDDILSRTVEVPATVHDWSRVMPPEEPRLTEEVLDETDVAPQATDKTEEEPSLTEGVLAAAAPPVEAEEAPGPAAEEPILTDEVLAETPPEVEPVEAPVPVADAPSLTEDVLDETDVAPEAHEAPEAPEAPDLTEEVLEEAEPERARQAGARAAEDEPGLEPESETDQVAPAKTPRPRRRRRVLVGVGAVVVLVIIVVVAASLSKSGGGSTPGQQVADAASATVAQQYAQVNITTNVPKGQAAAAGVVTGFSGSGTFDFATSQGSLTLSSPNKGGQEALVVDGSTMYLQPGSIVAQLVGGKPWVSLTAADLGAEAPSGFSLAPTLLVQLVGGPTTLLRELQVQGVTAHATSSLIYQGTPVDEYAVSLSPDAIAQRESGIPSSLQGSVVAGQKEDVYVSNGLVRAISVPFDVKSNGTTAMGTLTVGYTSWGDATDITSPASDQVASWAQLRNALAYASALK